jgi:probable phage associated protein
LQERIGTFDGNVQDAKQISTVIDCAHAAMKRNYPDMTREEVADLIDIGNMNEVFAAVMDVSGLKRKEQEAAQAGEVQTAD